MAANFFVKAGESFTVTLPFDVSDPENPQLIFARTLEEYPEALNAVPEEFISFETMKWRRPSWGMDCFLRESAYEGGSLQARVFSQEKFDTIRLSFLLLDSSFFDSENRVTFTKSGNYDALSAVSEAYIKQIDPPILKVFLAIAATVWDLGVPIKRLMSKEDYLTLRNDKNGFQKLVESKDLLGEGKKKSTKTGSATLKQDLAKPASAQPTAEMPIG